MAPLHARKKGVDANPRDWRARFGKFGKLLDGGLVLGNRYVALHATGGRGKRHHPAGIGIRVAGRAGKSRRQMCFVTVR